MHVQKVGKLCVLRFPHYKFLKSNSGNKPNCNNTTKARQMQNYTNQSPIIYTFSLVDLRFIPLSPDVRPCIFGRPNIEGRVSEYSGI